MSATNAQPDDRSDFVLTATLDVYEATVGEAMAQRNGSRPARRFLDAFTTCAAHEARALERMGFGNFLWLLAKRIHGRCHACTRTKCMSCPITGRAAKPVYGTCCAVSCKGLADRLTCAAHTRSSS